MKIIKVAFGPINNYRSVKAYSDDKIFYYSVIGNSEFFKIYYHRSGESIIDSSRYQKVPKEYHRACDFLKREFKKINWDSIRIINALSDDSQYKEYNYSDSLRNGVEI